MSKTGLSDNATFPVALTIAGSDSGGGAGIQTDLRTFRAFGVFGTSAITAVTSQNPLGVSKVDAVSPEGAAEQIRKVTSAIDVKAMKSGMLFSKDVIKAVADEVRKVKSAKTIPLVADPVMVATSGARLLREDAVSAVIDDYLPLADWITPNIPEAELLAGEKISSFDDCVKTAEKLVRKFDCSVILKGGHSEDDPKARDVIAEKNGRLSVITSERLPVKPHADHGTGCTFSAAFAACLARGLETEKAILCAKTFVFLSLRDAVCIADGSASSGSVYAMFPPSDDVMKSVIDGKTVFAEYRLL